MTRKEKSERLRLAARLDPAKPEELRRARELLGLTQAALAKALGRSPGNVGDWERCRNLPGPKSLQNLAALLRDFK